jgi:hypothetical protein
MSMNDYSWVLGFPLRYLAAGIWPESRAERRRKRAARLADALRRRQAALVRCRRRIEQLGSRMAADETRARRIGTMAHESPYDFEQQHLARRLAERQRLIERREEAYRALLQRARLTKALLSLATRSVFPSR